MRIYPLPPHGEKGSRVIFTCLAYMKVFFKAEHPLFNGTRLLCHVKKLLNFDDRPSDIRQLPYTHNLVHIFLFFDAQKLVEMVESG